MRESRYVAELSPPFPFPSAPLLAHPEHSQTISRVVNTFAQSCWLNTWTGRKGNWGLSSAWKTTNYLKQEWLLSWRHWQLLGRLSNQNAVKSNTARPSRGVGWDVGSQRTTDQRDSFHEFSRSGFLPSSHHPRWRRHPHHQHQIDKIMILRWR